jgi:LmbE family N-acetylglucosaminyl deacetylase
VSSIWRPIRERNPVRSLMAIVAHPGDEAFGFGGAIATAAADGAYVVVVCATRGVFDARLLDKAPAPGGRNRSYTKPTVWRNLDTVREDELRRSVAMLGVRVLRMLDYSETTLADVNYDDLVARIVEPIRMHRPEVILSFGPDGLTGDPDHVVLHRAVRDAFERAGEPLAYEDDIEEDQVAWRAAKLYELVAAGGELDVPGAPSAADGASVTLDLGEVATLKLAAINRHVTQTGSQGAFSDWQAEDRDRYLATESYRLARSNLGVPAGAGDVTEASLFDGLA